MAGDAMAGRNVGGRKCLGCRLGRGSHVHVVCGQHQAFLSSPPRYPHAGSLKSLGNVLLGAFFYIKIANSS